VAAGLGCRGASGVRAGDLGVGDLMPTTPDDPRLVPGYLESDDRRWRRSPARSASAACGVLSGSAAGVGEPLGGWRLRAAQPTWARSAPAYCGTCGFYQQLAAAWAPRSACARTKITPADGRVVNVEYGCWRALRGGGRHRLAGAVAELVYDDAELEVEQ